jgi:hypothetical protein
MTKTTQLLKVIEELFDKQVEIFKEITTEREEKGVSNLYADGIMEGYRQAHAIVKNIRLRNDEKETTGGR